MKKIIQTTIAAAVTIFLAGCAVSPTEVGEQVIAKTDDITLAKQRAAENQKQEPPLTRVKGNFLGSQPQQIDTTTLLPPIYRNVTLNFGTGQGNLSQVVRNIQSVTGLLVRLDPDLTLPANNGNAATNAASNTPVAANTVKPNTPPTPGTSLQPLQTLTAPTPAAAAATTSPSTPSSLLTRPLPLTFSGDLSDYLNQITGELGVSWEYANGAVRIFRIATRSWTLGISSGVLTYKDEMSSGGQGGGSTGSGTTGTQSFGSSSSSTVSGTLDAWKGMEDAIKAMLSPAGKYAFSQASGTLTVSDNKQVVDLVEKWVRHEVAILKAQVAIDVRTITVQLNDATSAGFDLNAVYSKLNDSTGSSGWAMKLVSPTSLASSDAGTASFNLVKPSSAWSGSSAAVQAMNSFGRVIGDFTDTIVTTNRVPGRTQAVFDQAYLASTTPASGGATTGGTGVPGLTPGVVTYGTNLTVIPAVGEDNTVLLQIFDTRSDLLGISSVSTGSGATLQQINTPTLARNKVAQNFHVGQGESLLIVGSNGDNWNSKAATGIGGASSNGTRTRILKVLIVTPRILRGA